MNNNLPLISVIVPIYNVDKYLTRCINSIVSNTYTNLEILLINDGSTDNSLNICNSFLSKDSRIKIYSKKNGGLSSARNLGIDKSTGKYISFIDSDDYISENFYEYLYNLIQKYNGDVSYITMFKTNNETDLLLKEEFKNNKVDEKIDILNKEEALERFHSFTYEYCLTSVVSVNKLYKKELFNNIYFPLNKLHEDEFTTYRAIANANKIIYSNMPLYAYFQRSNSIMNNSFNIKRLDALEAYDNYVSFFKENKLYDIASKACIRYFTLLIRLKKLAVSSTLNKDEIKKVSNILDNKFNEIINISSDLINDYNLKDIFTKQNEAKETYFNI